MNKQQGFLLVVLVLSGVMSFLIVLPFFQYILVSVLVAYVLYPVNQRLIPHLGPRLAPLTVMFGAVLAVFVPVGYLTFVLVRDLMALSNGETGIETGTIEREVADLTGRQIDLTDTINSLGEELLRVLFADVSAVVSFGVELSLGFGLVLFLVYYLLKDGGRFVEWVIQVAPMEDTVCSRLFHRIDDTAWGVVVGHLLVAVIQGLIGGVGLFVAGVPNVVFWTFAMIVLALLPLIGAFFVWAPAAAYLVAIGQTTAGVFLFGYGAVVVSLVDNYARPLLIDREAHLNPALILVGVFGGTYAIGMTGLFLGPIVLAVFATTISVFDDEYDALATRSSADAGRSSETDDQSGSETDESNPGSGQNHDTGS
jgi:predicted PurR-regulated permease PerM